MLRAPPSFEQGASEVFTLLEGLDAGRQRALVARGLVAMDDVLVDQRVDQRLRVLEGGGGIGLLAGGEGVVDLAQGRAHARTQRDVASAVGFSSTGGFFGRLGIRHEESPGT